jgi:hypothetical protein
MDASFLESLQYPIGKFHAPEPCHPEQRNEWIKAISCLPSGLSAVVQDLSERQLDTPYRPDGWSVRQVVHHVADSHMNSVIRFRWALTEDVPLIKAYDEALWAQLPDAASLAPQVSLDLLDGLHRRWTALLTQMTDADFERRLRHPESGELSLNKMLALYAWHGQHHVAHIAKLRDRMGW